MENTGIVYPLKVVTTQQKTSRVAELVDMTIAVAIKNTALLL